MTLSSVPALWKSLKLLSENRDVIKDTHGNVSCRTLSRDEMYIKPSGMPYDEIQLADLVRISWHTGTAQIDNSEGGKKPSVDWPHHMQIYEQFSEVGGICHTHSPYATAYAIAEKSISCCSTEQADYFGGDIKCLPYADMHSWGSNLVQFAVEHGLKKAYLLGKHGVITIGKNSIDAVRLAVEVENIAQKMFIARQLVGPWMQEPKHLPSGEVGEWHVRYNTTYGQK